MAVGEDMAVEKVCLVRVHVAGSFHGPCRGIGLFRGREGREDGGRLLVAGQGVTLAL